MTTIPKILGGHNIRDMKAFQRTLPNGKTVWILLWTIAAEYHEELSATMEDRDALLTGVFMLSDSHNFANARHYKWSILSARDGEHPMMIYANDNGHADDETAALCADLIRHYVHEITRERVAAAAH
jgi:hypothetical protein